MRGYAKIVGFLAVALVLVSVAMLNADQSVRLTLVPGIALPELPVFVIILLAMLGGVLVAALVSVPGHVRRGLQVRELRKRIARLEADRPTDRGSVGSRTARAAPEPPLRRTFEPPATAPDSPPSRVGGSEQEPETGTADDRRDERSDA